ncbi:hypothetical protein CERZMDRAFT_87862 [Cercospora zeae-maydis SCOH1-5]|uniref:Uncharacterized protein n=1 Tax=Cercospora zeae-maydis SCOH1-5 TaxID=717836 RepID=A0A6A6F6R8_9PEZI|nr:hypothetical protein CERZMDRAFT_87862 [Cercospora zeae-maydis SCOH1-5]
MSRVKSRITDQIFGLDGQNMMDLNNNDLPRTAPNASSEVYGEAGAPFKLELKEHFPGVSKINFRATSRRKSNLSGSWDTQAFDAWLEGENASLRLARVGELEVRLQQASKERDEAIVLAKLE